MSRPLWTTDRCQQLQIALTALKYRFHAKALDAAKYGVPQRRVRMILLGSRGELPSFARARTP